MAIIEPTKEMREAFTIDAYNKGQQYGHLWYNPVNDMYLTIEYTGGGDPDLRNEWVFAWVERPAVTTWIGFDGNESERFSTFITKDPDTKHGMIVPFKFKMIKDVTTILVDHILGVKFMAADLDDIGGLYV